MQFPHVETPSTYALGAMRAQAKQALRTMGFRASDVSRIIEAAFVDHPKPATLETLIVSALRHSQPPVQVHQPELIDP